jgi:glycosyltransferase involved in cell wall biosynthesis
MAAVVPEPIEYRVDATVEHETDASAAARPVARRWLTDSRVSVVVPALNEARNLPLVLPRIPKWISELILVDGGSTDGTVHVAKQLWPDIRVLQQTGRGKGAALRAGFAAATGDIIVMLDADGSTDPAEIPAFVGALLAGADLAKGSRFLQGALTSDMPMHRRLGNSVFVALVRMRFGGRFSDLCYGYNAFWRDVLPKLELDCDGFEIETVLNIRALTADLRVVEVPSRESKRVHGIGRLRTIPDGWRVLRAIGREAFRRGRSFQRRMAAESVAETNALSAARGRR